MFLYFFFYIHLFCVWGYACIWVGGWNTVWVLVPSCHVPLRDGSQVSTSSLHAVYIFHLYPMCYQSDTTGNLDSQNIDMLQFCVQGLFSSRLPREKERELVWWGLKPSFRPVLWPALVLCVMFLNKQLRFRKFEGKKKHSFVEHSKTLGLIFYMGIIKCN